MGQAISGAEVEAVVAMIRAAAMAGEVCPDNLTICARLGRPSRATAVRLMQIAEARGLIVVHRGHMARVVEAGDGSWRTAGETGRRHPRAHSVGDAQDVPTGPRQPRSKRTRETDEEAARRTRVRLATRAETATRQIDGRMDTIAPPKLLARLPQGFRYRTCQWPTGDKVTVGITFDCTDATCEGSSYCAAHHRLAYEPVPQRRAAA